MSSTIRFATSIGYQMNAPLAQTVYPKNATEWIERGIDDAQERSIRASKSKEETKMTKKSMKKRPSPRKKSRITKKGIAINKKPRKKLSAYNRLQKRAASLGIPAIGYTAAQLKSAITRASRPKKRTTTKKKSTRSPSKRKTTKRKSCATKKSTASARSSTRRSSSRSSARATAIVKTSTRRSRRTKKTSIVPIATAVGLGLYLLSKK